MKLLLEAKANVEAPNKDGGDLSLGGNECGCDGVGKMATG